MKKPLLIGFTVNALLFLTTFVFTMYNVKTNSTFLVNSYSQQISSNRTIKILNDTSHKQEAIMQQLVDNSTNNLKQELLLLDWAETQATFSKIHNKITKKNLSTKQKKLFNRLHNKKMANTQRQEKLLSLINQGKIGDAKKYYLNILLPRSHDLTNAINQLSEYQSNYSFKNLNEIDSRKTHVMFTLVSFFLLALIISGLLARRVIKYQKLNDEKLITLANTDSLTQLSNRPHFITELDQQINNSPSDFFSVVFLDIDFFKGINDSYGHVNGDKVLKIFANLLDAELEDDDIIARFGGDEFVIILRSVNSKKETFKFVEQLSKKLDTSLQINENEVFISSSMGVCTYPDDTDDAKSLLKNADIAMYSAKDAGRNTFHFHSEKDNELIEKNYKTSQTLHSILNKKNPDNELYMHYQPLFNVETQEISECEALMRWTNSDGIRENTNEFISNAEKTNLIEKINLFVIDEVCNQQKTWQKEGIKNIRININLSGNKATFSRLLQSFITKMEMMDLDPALFGIEITERTLFDITSQTLQELENVRSKGIKISIDDFGTGYSSLSYLKTLPVTTLKIDKAFIDDLAKDKSDQALVKAIISLGHSLSLDIVAEGVETKEQYDFLRDNGCNTIQGYFFHRPLDNQAISELQKIA